jgi:hypothetical protein
LLAGAAARDHKRAAIRSVSIRAGVDLLYNQRDMGVRFQSNSGRVTAAWARANGDRTSVKKSEMGRNEV